MLEVHAREPGDAVHRIREPHAACEIGSAGARGDAGRRLEGQGIAADVTRKPGPPAAGEHVLPAKARDALKPRQRERVAAALLGQIEIGNDDDEFAHDGVF